MAIDDVVVSESSDSVFFNAVSLGKVELSAETLTFAGPVIQKPLYQALTDTAFKDALTLSLQRAKVLSVAPDAAPFKLDANILLSDYHFATALGGGNQAHVSVIHYKLYDQSDTLVFENKIATTYRFEAFRDKIRANGTEASVANNIREFLTKFSVFNASQ